MIKYANQTVIKSYKGKKINVEIKDGKVLLNDSKKHKKVAFTSLSGAAKQVVGYRIDGRTFFGFPKVAGKVKTQKVAK